jgi:PAS domain S-box-containing protein
MAGNSNLRRFSLGANPFIATMGAIVLLAMLITTISLTRHDMQWTVFLCGVLAAAIIGSVSHTANARWVIARRTAQLKLARERAATETRLRAHAEAQLARLSNAVEMVDEALPAMLVYVDTEKRVRYHNRAYARWIGKAGNAIDGLRLEDIAGRSAYAEIAPHLQEALDGRDVRYERTETKNGDTCRLCAQYLPHFDKNGKVAGVFAILSDVTRAGDLGAPSPEAGAAPEMPVCGAGERLVYALEHDEFSLHCQPIAALGDGTPEAAFCEVLLRMQEEEDKLLPPGTFLPLAEELGLLHVVDRWVVRHIVDHAAKARAHRDSVYFVNLSTPTIRDSGFAQFVRDCLKSSRVPDHTLCFELSETDVLADPAAYREFIGGLDGTGCRFAVSASVCDPDAIRLLHELRVDFLKLDGGIVLGMLRSAAGLSRVKAISEAAHAAGMRIVAECVEDDRTRAALTRIGIDFAQGFGIAMPRPIHALDEELAQAEAARELDALAA